MAYREQTADMSSNAILEQFFIELPRLLEQARRHAFSNDLNILENFSMKIQDALNVLNVIVSRCEEVNAELGLTQEIRSLIGSIMPLHERLREAIAIDEDYIMNVNTQVATGTLEESNDVPGRPRLAVGKNEMERLFDIHRSWKEVASFLGVSTKTIQRRRIELGLTVSKRTGPRSTYTQILQGNLEQIVRDVLQVLPNAGESYIIGACRQRGINVQRQRIRDAINAIDPVSRALRRSISVIRRTYSVPAPNSLW